MASGDRRDRVGRVTRIREQRQDETEGAAVARKRTQTKGKDWADLPPFGEASAGYLYESETAAIQCTLHRERGGKAKAKVERVPAGDRARGVVCEERPVFRLKTGSVLCVKARQRARGRRERRWSKSDGKGNEKGS